MGGNKEKLDVYLIEVMLYQKPVFTSSPWRCVADQVSLIHYFSRSHTTTHHNLKDPLDEWAVQGRELYLTTQHSQQASMTPARLEPTISGVERPHSHPLDGAATENDQRPVDSS